MCRADIRADCNDDGLINGADDLLEDVEPLMLWTNSDDDNDNGVPDLEEANVVGENDLVELQLSAPSCSNFEWEWWGLSWEPTDAPIMVWWESDKSCSENCPKSVGAGIYNSRDDPGFVYPFSWLPRSVWLEALEPFDDLDITFTILPGASGKALGSITQDAKTDMVKTQAKPVVPFTIKLRVVMLMEENADPDDPQQYTGGTKLSRTEVKDLVQELIDNRDRIAPGLEFAWNRNAPDSVIVLESECLKLGPIPFGPNVSESCPYGFPAGNPRDVLGMWYWLVVNQDGSTAAHLRCPNPSPPPGQACYDTNHSSCPNPGVFCDGYDLDPCVLNLYFVGNMRESWAYAQNPDVPWDPDPFVPPFVVVSDMAGKDARDPKRPDLLSEYRVLEHEIGCHYLPRALHTELGHRVCPNDLCLDFNDWWSTCTGMGPFPVPDRIPDSRRTNTIQYNATCGGQP